jgi:hypothetical protein
VRQEGREKVEEEERGRMEEMGEGKRRGKNKMKIM